MNVVYPELNAFTEQKTFRYETLSFEARNTPTVIQLYLYPINQCEGGAQEVRVNLTYQQERRGQANSMGGALRSATASCKLSFPFFCQLLPEVKKDNDTFKLLFLLDKPAPSLLELFKDVVDGQPEIAAELDNPKQVTFECRNKVTVSVLVSKDDMKIRF